ncbi:MAG: hypothetical protein GW949_05970 [Spirochaetales bacterium]|nr:hypothetical protein [Spirochaetales bacterium]
MVRFVDKDSGLELGNPSEFYPDRLELPESFSPQQSTKSLIVSASGWRKVFVDSGDEEVSNPEIGFEDSILAGTMALSFVQFLSNHLSRPARDLTLLVGMDSRPTGPALADSILRVFSALEIEVEYLFICAAPEIMAYARDHSRASGFVYISASHNPIGHNGVKFGLSDGGVLGGSLATQLIQIFQKLLSNNLTPKEVFSLLKQGKVPTLARWFEEMPKGKKSAYNRYFAFSSEITGNTDRIIRELKNRKLGILGELNGSARSLSIDSVFLRELGVDVTMLNDQPRQIVHRIVPEGISLELCKTALEKLHKDKPWYQLGYVPDCDGDRGNLVYYDEVDKKAKEIEAQQVFALTVLAELSWLEFTGAVHYDKNNTPSLPTAVAVNGPTSARVDTIARAFGAEVHRAEVGEANVVNLARELRNKGYLVRILGEGSNGGNITFPSSVRDPLNTLVSLVKLLAIPQLLDPYCRRTGQQVSKDPSIRAILSLLPAYTTTSAYEDRALMKVQTLDHAVLKARYEEIFANQWPAKSNFLLEHLNVTQWREINYDGTNTRIGVGARFRSGNQRGGLKIAFLDSQELEKAYIWMRGSGTEPVFRILADVEGDNPSIETFLLDWQRSMVELADQKSSATHEQL